MGASANDVDVSSAVKSYTYKDGEPYGLSQIYQIDVPDTGFPPYYIFQNFGGEDGVNKDYHRIIISGIPKKSGEYRVTVSGFTPGTMYSGKDFYKHYTIMIK